MEEYVQKPDTSHYDDCRALMEMHPRRYRMRLIITLVLGVFNFFLQLLPMLSHGVLGLALGFLGGLYYIAVIVTAVKAKIEELTPLLTLMILLAAGTVLQFINLAVGLGLLLVYAFQFAEHRHAVWLKEQPGYPHFDHYLTAQEYGTQEFHSRYDIEDSQKPAEQAVMPDIGSETDADNAEAMQPVTEIWGNRPKKRARPTAQSFEEIAAPLPKRRKEMPAPVPEPELPRVAELPKVAEVPKVDFDLPADIPMPSWDIPDPVMDTSVITTSFPEIAGDIADLPEIPDIPQI